MHRVFQGRGGVHQEVVAQLQLRLVERSAESRRATRSEHRRLRIVNKNVPWLVTAGSHGREDTVSLARFSMAVAGQIQGEAPVRKGVGIAPAIGAEGEVTDPRLPSKLASVFNPVVEP